ncbi:hypothetical protein P378_11590 [Desulforamulus profundi]|uniref:Uncharacterized protein n=1 Tax=Desulforamulus profundi TaxID=1383067 RepID=A0A2C6L2G0_9FIRM|nr:hypothetical protein [Desulforamulus profundi]PHJ38181.1 hypothetical protein P378_11590 [Desulforamulus profundi]
MWSRPRTSHRSPPVILWGLAGEKIARGALRVPLLRGIPAAAGGEEDHLGGCSRWPAALVTGTGLRITEAGPVRIQAAAWRGSCPQLPVTGIIQVRKITPRSTCRLSRQRSAFPQHRPLKRSTFANR